jgi:uncharacterized membrane protein YfcA
MPSAELGVAVTALVSLAAGVMRGFTGFGGPAFMLAILTIFYPPAMIVGKVLVVDFFASLFLFRACFHEIKWRLTLGLAIPSILMLPVGHWLLLEMDADLLGRGISLTILVTSLVMLSGWRYRVAPGLSGIVAIGALSGFVFGASYIALVTVTAILLGPWNHREARSLIISWAFLVQVCFAAMTISGGTVDLNDVLIALPGAVLYLGGSWIGAHLFRGAGEARYRNVALLILVALSAIGLLY